MLFNSVEFLIFFPIVTLIFFVVPKKLRCFWLLIASYYFYMCWNPQYAVLIGASTVVTYLSGIAMASLSKKKTLSAEQKIKGKKLIVAGSLIFNLGILVVFKYANFFLENIYGLLNQLGISVVERTLDILLPVGISFYTFQALSYTLDVYRENIDAEKSLIKYALFVSFFPQLVAGPIERTGNLLTQIRKIETESRFDFENIRHGLLLMFWGLFQKLVIADRAAILVDTVYNNYTAYGFMSITAATIIFAFQIYCDFDGYTNIARGAARILGIHLIKNFKQPYLATNIQDFWRRWHVSLTSWFTDYLYIPLGGSRKGTKRHLVNVLIVFTISGLWHGANWTYVVWGFLHALYQCVGIMRRKAQKNAALAPSLIRRIASIMITFGLVDFAWIFFRAESLSMTFRIFLQMLTHPGVSSLLHMGLNPVNMGILIVSLLILLFVDILHEKNISIFKAVFKMPLWRRWIIYAGLIWSCILLGIYGIAYTSSQFIYFQF